MNRDKIKGLILGFSATFCWASFYIVSRYFFGTDSDGLDPLWSSCLRYLLASLILFVCLVGLKQLSALKTALRKDWKMLLLLGLIGIAGESTLLHARFFRGCRTGRTGLTKHGNRYALHAENRGSR